MAPDAPAVTRRLEVLPTPDELYRRAAAAIAEEIGAATRARGSCGVALSRGQALFTELGLIGLEWGAVDVFQADERVAAEGSDDRNLASIVGELGDLGARLHPMPVTGDLDDAARRYADDLRDACGEPPVLDVVHLGLGADGHTASLVAGDPVLDVTDADVAATGPHQGCRRLTLTLPALSRARLVVFVVSGTAKADAVRRLVDDDRTIPAACVRAARVLVCADAGAASALVGKTGSDLQR